MSRILRDRLAERDLIEIAEYIGVEKQSPTAAMNFLDEIEAKMAAYARQPLMGEERSDLGEGLRSFTFKSYYVVVYRPLEDGIDVLRVIHGYRDYQREFD